MAKWVSIGGTRYTNYRGHTAKVKEYDKKTKLARIEMVVGTDEIKA